MRKFIFISVSVLAFVLTAGAQDISYFKKNIRELSSKKYGGRGYDKDNDGKAAGYIAGEFVKCGAVTPAKAFGEASASKAGINGYFQQITFPINDFNGKADFYVDGKKLRPGYDYVINSYSGGGKGRYKLYYIDTAGYNIQNTLNFLEKNGKDLVVVMDFGREYYRILVGIRMKNMKIAGMVLLNSSKNMRETMKMVGGMDMGSISPLSMSKSYMEMLMMDHPHIVVDAERFPAGASAVEFDIEPQLRMQEQSSNVIAVIPGSSEPDSIFVFTAHYDHLGMLGKKVFYPGANDNASGTSMLLALARYYGKPENKPANTLVFVATTGEEMGLLGSRKFTETPPFNLKKIKYVLNFDMVADRTDTLSAYSDKCGMRGIELFKSINGKEGLFKEIAYGKYQQNSDHYYFLRKKIPAVCFIFEKGVNFGKLHTPGDNMDNISLENFNKLFVLATDFVKQY